MKLNWESGFKRITVVLSSLIGIVGLFLTALESNQRLLVFSIFAALAAIPWFLFFVLRWIAKGFRDEPQSHEGAPQTQAAELTGAGSDPVQKHPNEAPQAVDAESAKSDGRFKNTFWPTIRSASDAKRCVKFAVQCSLFVGGVTGILSLIALFGHPLLGMTGAGLFDAAIFLALAYGINAGNRIAAAAAFCFYLIEVITTWTSGAPRFGVMQLMFLLWFGGGIRGTFYLRAGTSLLRDVPLPGKRILKGVAYGGLSIIAIVFAVTCEWFLHKTILGRPGYKWSTKSIPGQEIVAEGRDYKLSFKGTRLDWRKQYDITKEGHDLNYFLVGYPGLLLAVWEESGDVSRFTDEQLIVTKLGFSEKERGTKKVVGAIDVPRAVKGKFFVMEDARGGEKMVSIMGVYRSPTKLVTLRFVPYPPTDGTPVKADDSMHDMSLIASSFEFQK